MRLVILILSVIAAFLAACASQVGISLPEEQSTGTVTLALPTATIEPKPTEDPDPHAELQLAGDEEVVYDWSRDRCRSLDIPDLPVRAFRDSNNQVQLIISHLEPIRLVGSTLDDLQVDCSIVHFSTHDPDPAMHSDSEWIAAPYTEDGQTIFALAHDEYHGWEHNGQCSSAETFDCWYNTITLLVSTDSGNSYDHALTPPDHFVAGLPTQYEINKGPYGLFGPSNIIKGRDGYFYSFVKMQAYLTQTQSVCLMRTDDLTDPGSWRFWDGEGFEGMFADPYRQEIRNGVQYICDPIARDEIGWQMLESITFNTALNRYVLVGISADALDGRDVWGFYYSFSNDLVHWTPRKLLLEVPLPWTVGNNQDVSYLYPALLDPDSETRNFETVDETAYLYFTRHNFGQGSLDRDLIRVPVEFVPSP